MSRNGEWCKLRNFIGPFDGITKLPDAMHCTNCEQLFCRIRLCCEQHCSRNGPRHLSSKSLDRPVIHHKAQFCRGNANNAVGRSNSQIAYCGKLCTSPKCRAVNGSERDTRQLCEASQHLVQLGMKIFLTNTSKIGTSTECRRCTR